MIELSAEEFSERFDEIYKIMEEAFPAEERRPYDKQKDLYNNGMYRVSAVFDNKKIIAFSAYWDIYDFIFVEHIAVHKDGRNRGIGGQMISALTEKYKKTLILEVEPPISELAQRRVVFYKRCGFHLNDFYYIQPALQNKEIELKIMSYPKSLNINEFIIIKDKLYKYVYNK